MRILICSRNFYEVEFIGRAAFICGGNIIEAAKQKAVFRTLYKIKPVYESAVKTTLVVIENFFSFPGLGVDSEYSLFIHIVEHSIRALNTAVERNFI